MLPGRVWRKTVFRVMGPESGRRRRSCRTMRRARNSPDRAGAAATAADRQTAAGGAGPEANLDRDEVERFERLAARWWDPEGDFRPLHDLNPVRLGFIDERAALDGRAVLDVGCGGGLLAEAMHRRGARVTGIDAGEAAIAVARSHAAGSGAGVRYERATAEELAARAPGRFDVVTCLEILEHVPDPASLVTACAALARPDGHVFFSTIHRTPKAWLFAVVGAEHILGLLPRGTHDYGRFLRPSELDRAARGAGLELAETAGLRYDPFTGRARTGGRPDVNYLAWYRRPAESPGPAAPGPAGDPT